jgi:ribosomal-protein-alanine N-acetyltransferase
MNAVLQPVEARFEPLTRERLDAVLAVEQSAYAHPWVRANFIDALDAGYQAQVLLARRPAPGVFRGDEGRG